MSTAQYKIFFDPSLPYILDKDLTPTCIECGSTGKAGNICKHCGHQLYCPMKTVDLQHFFESGSYPFSEFLKVQGLRIHSESGDEFRFEDECQTVIRIKE